LIGKDNNFIAIIVELFHFFGDRLMPINPIFSIFGEGAATFGFNQSAIHIEAGYFFFCVGSRLSNNTSFYVLPSPLGELLFLCTLCFALFHQYLYQ